MAGIMNESDEEADLNQLILEDDNFDDIDGKQLTFNSKTRILLIAVYAAY